jgi:hypothetical protein
LGGFAGARQHSGDRPRVLIALGNSPKSPSLFRHHRLDYNAGPYAPRPIAGAAAAIPIGNLQSFTSLNFTQIIKALQAIADNLGQLSAFGFLDEAAVREHERDDVLDYAARFAG